MKSICCCEGFIIEMIVLCFDLKSCYFFGFRKGMQLMLPVFPKKNKKGYERYQFINLSILYKNEDRVLKKTGIGYSVSYGSFLNT
jgi:hypothetical protein